MYTTTFDPYSVPVVSIIISFIKQKTKAQRYEARQALRHSVLPSGSRSWCSHPQALSGGCEATCKEEPYPLPLSLESHLESWTGILFCTQTSWKHLLYCLYPDVGKKLRVVVEEETCFFSTGSELLARRETRLIKCEVWPKIWFIVNSTSLGLSIWLHNWPLYATEPS